MISIFFSMAVIWLNFFLSSGSILVVPTLLDNPLFYPGFQTDRHRYAKHCSMISISSISALISLVFSFVFLYVYVFFIFFLIRIQ